MFAVFTITLAGLVSLIVYLLIAGCVIGLLFYLIQVVPVPEPWKGWIRIALTVLVVLFVIGFLLSLIGVPIVRFG